MFRLPTLVLVCGMLAVVAPPEAQAASQHPKMQKAGKAKAQAATRRATRVSARRDVTAAERGPELQDRTTVYHANGRLNGKALFDDISERTSGAGE